MKNRKQRKKHKRKQRKRIQKEPNRTSLCIVEEKIFGVTPDKATPIIMAIAENPTVIRNDIEFWFLKLYKVRVKMQMNPVTRNPVLRVLSGAPAKRVLWVLENSLLSSDITLLGTTQDGNDLLFEIGGLYDGIIT